MGATEPSGFQRLLGTIFHFSCEKRLGDKPTAPDTITIVVSTDIAIENCCTEVSLPALGYPGQPMNQRVNLCTKITEKTR